MTDNEVNAFLTEYSIWLILGLGIILILWLVLRWRQNRNSDLVQRQITNAIEQVGAPYVREVVLPDEVDGFLLLDYVVLFPGRILVINIFDYEGFLFGGEKVDQWTQIVKNRTNKFLNPLYKMHECTEAVYYRVKNFPVSGIVVFTNIGQFPRGIPQGVVLIDELQGELRKYAAQKGEVGDMKLIWEQLLEEIKRVEMKLHTSAP